MNTQYDNIIDIINNDILIDNNSEKSILTSILKNNSDFQNTLINTQTIDTIITQTINTNDISAQDTSININGNSTNTFSSQNYKRYYDVNMVKYDDINSNIIDMDILLHIYTQKAFQYYFFIDLLSEFYHSLMNNNNKYITIKSRYTIYNNIWAHYTTDAVDKYFTFDIYYDEKNTSSFVITNIHGSNITKEIIEQMCMMFKNDILKHLSYINKIDLQRGGNEYLENIYLFYKLCRLKLHFLIFGNIDAWRDDIVLCLQNISNKINDITISSQKEIKTITMYEKTADLQRKIENDNAKIKMNSDYYKKKEIQFKETIMYVSILFIISFLTILYVALKLTLNDDIFFLLVMTILLILYFSISKIQFTKNYEYFTEESDVNSIFDKIKNKIYNNILKIVQRTTNDIALTSIENTFNRATDVSNSSNIYVIKSKGFINEQRIQHMYIAETLHFILKLIIATFFIYIFSYLVNIKPLYILPGIYIVMFGLYTIELVKIVRTRSHNIYWVKPSLEKL